MTTPDPDKTGLENAIDDLLSQMNNLSGDDKEYAQMVTQLNTLYHLKEVDHKEHEFYLKSQELLIKQEELKLKEKEVDHAINSKKYGVSLETWALIGGNLAGIILIVGHERAHVLTSKALGFLPKLR